MDLYSILIMSIPFVMILLVLILILISHKFGANGFKFFVTSLVSIFIIVMIYMLISDSKTSNWVETKGTLVDSYTTNNRMRYGDYEKDEKNTYYTYEYTDQDGNKYKTKSSNDDSFIVRYNPKNPSQSTTGSFLSDIVFDVIFMVIGIIVLMIIWIPSIIKKVKSKKEKK